MREGGKRRKRHEGIRSSRKFALWCEARSISSKKFKSLPGCTASAAGKLSPAAAADIITQSFHSINPNYHYFSDHLLMSRANEAKVGKEEDARAKWMRARGGLLHVGREPRQHLERGGVTSHFSFRPSPAGRPWGMACSSREQTSDHSLRQGEH